MENNHKKEIDMIEKEIAEEACRIVYEETKGLGNEDGGFNPNHLWKLKHKILPKPCNVPTAMNNLNGKLITNIDEIKKNTINHYENVLRNRPIKEDLEKHKIEKDDLCKIRLELYKKNKTPDWTKKDILEVLKGLKTKKSRDPNDYANEICNPKVAGEDLVQLFLH